MIVSWGTTAWELALWRAASCGAALDIVCPVHSAQDERAAVEQLSAQFGLAPCQVDWTFLKSRRASGRCKDTWTLRDQIAASKAHLVVPISIRPGGRWDTWMRTEGASKPLDLSWSTPWSRRAPTPRYVGHFDTWPNGFDASGGALLHFTRAPSGPWPGEAASDYYRAIAEGSAGDPRDGFHTLERILREGRLRGSSHRIRSGSPVVCFTSMPLAQTSALFRWRARYARLSFEPYGLAIAMGAAMRLGARAVRYDGGAQGGLGQDPWHQSAGKRADWRSEQEWRIPGDVDLSGLHEREAAVLVASATERERLCESSRFPVLSLERTQSSAGRNRES